MKKGMLKKLTRLLAITLVIVLLALLVVKMINQNEKPNNDTEKVIEKIEDIQIGINEETVKDIKEIEEVSKEDTITTSNIPSIVFYKDTNTYVEPFNVINMFPGDYIEKQYVVSVRHKGPIDINFQIQVADKYKDLADVLITTVECENKKIYEGPLSNTDSTYRITSNAEQTDRITYKIAVYLPTSTGNEYQNKECIADFYWEAIEVGDGYLAPNTGVRKLINDITNNTYIYAILIIIVLALVYYLYRGTKNEE